jgi:uncharacterized protein YcbK (DUF882 family)
MNTNIQIGDGVNICGLKQVMQIALVAVHKVYRKYNYPLEITSAFRDEYTNNLVGGHPRSKHLCGEAIDISISGIHKPIVVQQDIMHKIKELGFDVVLESDHIHIEYDPK